MTFDFVLFFFWFRYKWLVYVAKIGLTIIANVFLSTKSNDNHQADTVGVFQSKDFRNFTIHMHLLSSILHILYWE